MQLQGYNVPAHLHCVNIVDVEAITVCYRMLMNVTRDHRASCCHLFTVQNTDNTNVRLSEILRDEQLLLCLQWIIFYLNMIAMKIKSICVFHISDSTHPKPSI